MKEFHYSALTPTGQTVTGMRHATDAEALAEALFAQNLILTECRRPLMSLLRTLRIGKRVGRSELRDFTLHLATSLSAGVSIIAALRDFEDGDASDGFRAVVSDVREEIAGGAQVGEALARHPDIFSDIYISLATAGQQSGNLAENFTEMTDYIEWLDELQSRTRQAMIYPCILLTGLIGLFLLLMLYVLPRFTAIFADQDFEMPALTRRVINSWEFFRHWWPALIGVVVGAVVGTGLLGKSSRGRYVRDLILLRLPVIGQFRHRLALSRFTRHFSLLLTSGIDLRTILNLLERVVGDAVMQHEIATIRTKITTGETMAGSFKDSSWFPPLVQRLIAVGEQSGNLDTTMAKAAEYVDKEIPRALKRAFTLFEAVVMILLGSMIAVFALSLLLPILQMRSQIH